MGKKKGANRALTQEEIWDDSALVQSWDEAVEEYNLYHSIHAKGENVEDVLREAEAKEEADAAAERAHAEIEDEKDDDMADADALRPAQETHPVLQAVNGRDDPCVGAPKEQGTANPIPHPAAAIPQPLLNQVQDEGLKNLMMAWYYAGYYTGLYEGQRGANQNKGS
ncbi:hypothetical protein ARAM_004600 [Aspergillus rambellii]|uniref:Survival Motor Neuron Gemin2-binding domain-containing protein n=1 Tax=Aspergillus rambellii TaxID=308745 RepID=A0A0F8WQW1_9EURO|nr:hypothetical protein ARAM_004600 [Aspergillus rambellii]